MGVSMALGFSGLALDENKCCFLSNGGAPSPDFVYNGDLYAGGNSVGNVDVTENEWSADIYAYADKNGSNNVYSRFMNYVNKCGGAYIGNGNAISSYNEGNFMFTGILTIGDDHPIWASHTEGNPGAQLVMREDGNLVICSPIWASHTEGHPGATLTQEDGNLVIYDVSKTIWATGTENLPVASYCFDEFMGRLEVLDANCNFLWRTPPQLIENRPYRLIAQNDGNLVIYDKNNNPVWAAGTGGRPAGKTSLVMQEDGNLVLNYQQALWASHTEGHDGATFVMQGDGNLVIHDKSGNLLWQSHTEGHPGVTLTMQEDGNLVISGPVWESKTFGHDGATYKFQDDGNLVVLDKDGHTVLWSSGTGGHPKYFCRLDVQSDGNLVIYENYGNYPIALMQLNDDYFHYWYVAGINAGWTSGKDEWDDSYIATPDGRYKIYGSSSTSYRFLVYPF